MKRTERVRKLCDEAYSSSLQKNATDFPLPAEQNVTAICPHVTAFRQDSEPHLTWLSRIPRPEGDVFLHSCPDCIQKIPSDIEEMITHRRATLILTAKDTRTLVRIYESQGHELLPVSERGKSLLASMNA